MFLYCSSAFFVPAGSGLTDACGAPADCAFAISIITPPTAKDTMIPKTTASFFFINNLIRKWKTNSFPRPLRIFSVQSRLITVNVLTGTLSYDKLLRQQSVYARLLIRRHKQEYSPAPRPVP